MGTDTERKAKRRDVFDCKCPDCAPYRPTRHADALAKLTSERNRMMNAIERFYAYADRHALRILITREKGAWTAFIPEDHRPSGAGRTIEAALESLAAAVAGAGLERDIPAPAPTREKLPPFVMTEGADA